VKIAIVAHGHPVLSAGGGERAAYSLFEHLKDRRGVEPVFVARASPSDIAHDAWFGAFRGRRDEFLWSPPPFVWFRRVTANHDVLRLQVRTLVDSLQPDIVHFHHYIFFGLDAMGIFKELAGCPTVLTLHEYGLICHHDGQMVKPGTLHLCHEASPAECHACFTEFTAGQFFLREMLIKQLLDDVDGFVSPSRFLRDRHVSWGIDSARIRVIENLLPPRFDVNGDGQSNEADRTNCTSGRIRFGFFGQLNRFKGADVLLNAVKHLERDVVERIEIILFGAKLEEQEKEFQDALRAKIESSAAKVSFFGPYRNDDVPRLLRSVDWMVLPSIWWENSPLVIQEARAVGTPILASNIGGMAEKIRNGVDGLLFLAGSDLDLASKIESVVRGTVAVNAGRLDFAAQNLTVLEAHVRLYEELLAAGAARS
jgi:glycosyltransferase involved in cell wall biosynthesis